MPVEALFFGHFMKISISELGPWYFSEAGRLMGEMNDEGGNTNLVFAVARIIRQHKGVNLDIDGIVEGLCNKEGNIKLLQDDEKKRTLQRCVFAAIGVLTLLFRPAITHKDVEAFTIESPRTEPPVVRVNIASNSGRRIPGLLRAFGEAIPFPSTAQPRSTEASNDDLHVAQLNFDSLHHIAGINIQWTDALSLHLCLRIDGESKTLYLFRVPSFCVLNLDGTTSNSVYHCILDKFEECLSLEGKQIPSVTTKSLGSEILRSYLLIFSDASSRKLFGRNLKDLARVGNRIDPVLLRLCERPPILSDDSSWDISMIRDTYQIKTHFPHLGDRLLLLQNQNNESPRTLRRMIQDSRHPLESLNLRAVIVFGVLSLLFAFLSVVIGILQLVYGIRQG